MKHSEFIKVSQTYTSKASDITRQMILAGVGIIWLFKDKDSNTLERFTVWPLITLAFALLLDLSQYVIGGELWKQFYNEKDKNLAPDQDPEFAAPKQFSRPIYALYYLKIGFMIISYILIIIFLIKNLSFK